jgi:antitoxin ParD1/3/4
MHDKTHMERIDVPLDESLREHLELRTSGEDFPDAGSYVRALIEDDRQRLEELRAAIQAGIDSGVSERDPWEIWEEVKRRHRETSAQ